jgi:hypothetical protein
MGAFDHRKALVVLIGALFVAPAAQAWVLTTKGNPIQAENAPGIVPVGYVTLATPSEDVAWDCSSPVVEVLVGTAYLHAQSGTWRRNVGLDVNPPSGDFSASCDLHDQTGALTHLAIQFTGLGIEIEFVGAG